MALLALVSLSWIGLDRRMVLPDRRLAWRDVIAGAIGTAVLFEIGKPIIGWYIGTGAVASPYGAERSVG